MLIFILTVIIIILALQLLRYRREWNRLALQLEETGPDSNMALRAGVRSRPFLRFLSDVNERLEAGREAGRKIKTAQEDLKYTISCVSHDIRTPLTGASGYLQLLEKCEEEEKRDRYMEVIASKLNELNKMLNELFTYTKLGNEDYPMKFENINVYKVLCGVMAEFYKQFEEKGTKPEIIFENKNMEITADSDALKRIFSNLTDNALKHGMGNLIIRQKGDSLTFENEVKLIPDTRQLFERFYRADASRNGTSTGLGLAIVKQLIDKMDGSITAAMEHNSLIICLRYPQLTKGYTSLAN